MYLCWNRVFGTKKQTYIQILFVFPENWDAMNLYKPLSMCMCARTQKARNWFTNLSKLNASMLGRKCKYRLKSTEQHVMTPLTCKSGILWTMNFLPCDPVPNSSESRFWWGRLWRPRALVTFFSSCFAARTNLMSLWDAVARGGSITLVLRCTLRFDAVVGWGGVGWNKMGWLQNGSWAGKGSPTRFRFAFFSCT